MMSSLLKVSVMTQMDFNFCNWLFYIFLRNVMAFDKAIAILYGFFNLRISKKNYASRRKGIIFCLLETTNDILGLIF